MPFSLPQRVDGQNETINDWIMTTKSGLNYRQCKFSAGRCRNQLKTDQSLCSFSAWRGNTRKKVWHWTVEIFARQSPIVLSFSLFFFFYLKARDDATDSATCLAPFFSSHSLHMIFISLQRLFGSSEHHLWCPGMRMDFKTTTLVVVVLRKTGKACLERLCHRSF